MLAKPPNGKHATEGLNPSGHVNRDACRHLQGQKIRLRHALTNVCCRENSGKHLLVGRISPFGPEADIEVSDAASIQSDNTNGGIDSHYDRHEIC
jgi:hypothetical protein